MYFIFYSAHNHITNHGLIYIINQFKSIKLISLSIIFYYLVHNQINHIFTLSLNLINQPYIIYI